MLASLLSPIAEALDFAIAMTWEILWALVLGFALSAVVQAVISKGEMIRLLPDDSPRSLAIACGLGAASSSCSYAAIAIGRSLFAKGASAAVMLAFQFASTNLVWELGLVLWVLLGWQFTLAEFVGGAVLIVLMSLVLRVFISPRLEAEARKHAQHAEGGHDHPRAEGGLTWKQRVRSVDAWTDVAANFVADWKMLWKEITLGFFLAGFIGLLGNDFFNGLFITDGPSWLRTIENVIIGPVIAVLSFVCSIGNVPLAAVLWSGGISFAGVLAFIFADLIVLPIVLAYRKYYGWKFAWRISVMMFGVIVVAALIVDGLFGLAGIIPTTRPSRADVFGTVEVDYKLFLNILGVIIFATLFWLTRRRTQHAHAAHAEHAH